MALSHPESWWIGSPFYGCFSDVLDKFIEGQRCRAFVAARVRGVVFCVAAVTHEQLQGHSPQGVLTDGRHSHQNAAVVLLVASYITPF